MGSQCKDIVYHDGGVWYQELEAASHTVCTQSQETERLVLLAFSFLFSTNETSLRTLRISLPILINLVKKIPQRHGSFLRWF